jgi:hypothetical protein
VPGTCNYTTNLYAVPTTVTSLFTYVSAINQASSDECCIACAVDPNCNIAAYCVDQTGCTVPELACANGPPNTPATFLGPLKVPQPTSGVAAACLPGGLFPRFTCMFLNAGGSPVGAPSTAQPFGWVSAVLDPATQPNWQQIIDTNYPAPFP